MKELFESRNLQGSISIKMDEHKGIWNANKGVICSNIIAIAEEYLNNGYTLTLRQLYYQLVSRDIIPNHDKVYKKISSIKDDIVYSGLVDWRAFEDRGRVPVRAYSENSIPDALQRTVNSYKLDRQLNQPVHIEVWTEKDAISGILKQVTLPLSVPLVINKGYNSSTAMYNAYTRFADILEKGRKVKILYFGDHDPSGLDMVRDIRDRLIYMFTYGERLAYKYTFVDKDNDNNFYDRMREWWEDNDYSIYDLVNVYPQYEYSTKIMRNDYDGGSDDKAERMWDAARLHWYIDDNELFDIQHIGLTMEQIERYNPPPNPAKITDPRAKYYIEKYGGVSWEVDALSPEVMGRIVSDAIWDVMDEDIYNEVMERENSEVKALTELVEKFK